MPTHAFPPPTRTGASCAVPDVAGAALKGFFQLTERWGLDAREQMGLLGQPPRSTFFAWKSGERINPTPETLERIGCVLGIWKALRLQIPDPAQAAAWIRTPNNSPLFEGGTPLAFMTRARTPDLADVRRLLDAHLGVL